MIVILPIYFLLIIAYSALINQQDASRVASLSIDFPLGHIKNATRVAF